MIQTELAYRGRGIGNALVNRHTFGGHSFQLLHGIRGGTGASVFKHVAVLPGGASSHDIRDGILSPASPDFEKEYWLKRRTGQIFRVKGVSWWPEELPSDDEYQEAMANLDKAGWCMDCILTHCAPTSIARKIDPHYQLDRLRFSRR